MRATRPNQKAAAAHVPSRRRRSLSFMVHSPEGLLRNPQLAPRSGVDDNGIERAQLLLAQYAARCSPFRKIRLSFDDLLDHGFSFLRVPPVLRKSIICPGIGIKRNFAKKVKRGQMSFSSFMNWARVGSLRIFWVKRPSLWRRRAKRFIISSKLAS